MKTYTNTFSLTCTHARCLILCFQYKHSHRHDMARRMWMLDHHNCMSLLDIPFQSQWHSNGLGPLFVTITAATLLGRLPIVLWSVCGTFCPVMEANQCSNACKSLPRKMKSVVETKWKISEFFGKQAAFSITRTFFQFQTYGPDFA